MPVLIDDSSMNLRINLTVLSAKHLPSMDFWGKCDGLVEIDFDGNNRKTNQIKQNYDPEWNEQFDFTFHRATFDAKGVGDLVLRVKDHDAASGADDIGEAIVSGQEIMKFIKSGEEGKTAEFFDLPVKDKKGVQVKGNDGQPCVINIKMKLFLPEKKQDNQEQVPLRNKDRLNSTPPTPQYREPERPRPTPTGNAAKDAALVYEFMKQEKDRERDGDGRANIPVLGVKVNVISESVFIAAVDPYGPLSGLVRQGDSIVKINGLPMLSAKQIKQEILYGPPGSDMNLTVFQVSCMWTCKFRSPSASRCLHRKYVHRDYKERSPGEEIDKLFVSWRLHTWCASSTPIPLSYHGPLTPQPPPNHPHVVS
jgi:hypothetical protein